MHDSTPTQEAPGPSEARPPSPFAADAQQIALDNRDAKLPSGAARSKPLACADADRLGDEIAELSVTSTPRRRAVR